MIDETLHKKLLPISVNKKSMLTPIKCRPRKCKGKCCKTNMSYGRYFKEECDRFPSSVLSKLILSENGNEYYAINENGICNMLDICLKHQRYKPIQCILFPIKLTKKSRKMTLHRWIWLGSKEPNCIGYKKGKPAYISLKDDIIEAFGVIFYGKLKAFMKSDLPDEAFATFNENSSLDKWIK